MISITCTNCRTTLEMDEAFAGGVCRCQFCGTIQTVPSNLKATAGAAKSFYSTSANRSGGGGGAPAESSGLDDLANAVSSSSGLSASGLRSKARPGPARATGLDYQKPQPAGNGKPVWMIVAGAVILALLGVVAFQFLRSDPGTGPTVVGPTGPGGTPLTPTPATPVVTAGPNFAGLGIDGGGKVVYVVDRGNSTDRFFDPLKYAIAKSIESLGSGSQFAVVFWRRASDADLPMAEMSFPDAGLAKATADGAAAFLRKFQDLTAGGATNIDQAIREAVARNPSAIVIATAKDDLNLDGVAEAVERARGSNPVKVHTVTLGGSGASSVLKAIAAKTGGRYGQVDERALQDQ